MSMKQMSVEELKTRMDAGETVHLIDVREDHERADFNIGGLHYKLGLITAMQFDDIEHLKDEEVIVHCRSGKRSMMACTVLESMGFKNTVNVEGGILAWQEKFGATK